MGNESFKGIVEEVVHQHFELSNLEHYGRFANTPQVEEMAAQENDRISRLRSGNLQKMLPSDRQRVIEWATESGIESAKKFVHSLEKETIWGYNVPALARLIGSAAFAHDENVIEDPEHQYLCISNEVQQIIETSRSIKAASGAFRDN